jgi:hypothetical protein
VNRGTILSPRFRRATAGGGGGSDPKTNEQLLRVPFYVAEGETDFPGTIVVFHRSGDSVRCD